ncbi:hypothetical protein ACFQ2M_41825 [Kitasatospora saccharophila]|uniref:hypothetical protein n=1 Tax=Kitasatospora saccharophila TaxID=407973 RepID=UPI003635A3EC
MFSFTRRASAVLAVVSVAWISVATAAGVTLTAAPAPPLERTQSIVAHSAPDSARL